MLSNFAARLFDGFFLFRNCLARLRHHAQQGLFLLGGLFGLAEAPFQGGHQINRGRLADVRRCHYVLPLGLGGDQRPQPLLVGIMIFLRAKRSGQILDELHRHGALLLF